MANPFDGLCAVIRRAVAAPRPHNIAIKLHQPQKNIPPDLWQLSILT
jgi:hypothetical protein